MTWKALLNITIFYRPYSGGTFHNTAKRIGFDFLKQLVMIGIYKITSPNNRVYIGQSVNIYRRFATYKLNKDKGKQPRLYGSFKKYGFKQSSFRGRLNGNNPNKTPFIYV